MARQLLQKVTKSQLALIAKIENGKYSCFGNHSYRHSNKMQNRVGVSENRAILALIELGVLNNDGKYLKVAIDTEKLQEAYEYYNDGYVGFSMQRIFESKENCSINALLLYAQAKYENAFVEFINEYFTKITTDVS